MDLGPYIQFVIRLVPIDDLYDEFRFNFDTNYEVMCYYDHSFELLGAFRSHIKCGLYHCVKYGCHLIFLVFQIIFFI